ncbi:MAG TPA: hypothetical protein VMT73_10110 [Anaerolineales bacterium]|nr:hypothetical protein [Anaerolineales bacterium]
MKPMRWLTSIFLSICFAISLAARFFHLLDRPLTQQLLLILVPAIGFGVLIFQVFPFFESHYSKNSYHAILFVQALTNAALFAALSNVPLSIRVADFISAFGLSLVFLVLFISSYKYIAPKKFEFVVSWLIASLPAFFAAGYLSHLYPIWSFSLLTILTQIFFGLGLYFLVCHLADILRTRFLASILSLLTVISAFAFALSIIGLCLHYPNLFDRSVFVPDASLFPLFLFFTVLSPAFLAQTLQTLDQRGWLNRWRTARLYTFLRENFPGILLGLAFFAAYASLSYVFNHPKIDTTENYFAADNFAWMGRLAADNGTTIEMRSVHPFAYFVFRPITWLFSLIFNGDRYAATLLLIPLMGGLCVLLIWLIVKRWTGSRTYASLIATLLGVSTSHLLFGSIVESYIFSAAVLLLFFLLLLDERTSLFTLVAVGALTFGITITNFIQTFIGFVVARFKLKTIFLYGLFASASSITLTVLHAALFPSALLFFDPAGAGVESQYAIPVFGEPAWRLIGRAMLLLRNIFMYSLIAPKPFALTTEVGGRFPRFNFFKLSPGTFDYSGYDTFGKIVLAVWFLLLTAAALAFVWNIIRMRKVDLSLAFPLVLLFNFVLHMGYGSEPFLYAADWTYALILFVAVSLMGFGKQHWFQAALLIFLVLLMVNQWEFMSFILKTISPFFT